MCDITPDGINRARGVCGPKIGFAPDEWSLGGWGILFGAIWISEKGFLRFSGRRHSPVEYTNATSQMVRIHERFAYFSVSIIDCRHSWFSH